MEPIQDMVAEHGKIKLALRIWEKMLDNLLNDMWPSAEHFNLMADFTTTFADLCHHGKEENIYFPAMLKKANLKDATIIDRLTSEHKKGRQYIFSIKNDLPAYNNKNSEAKERIINNLRKYIELLDKHIDEENNFLFPQSSLYLSEEEMTNMMIDFKKAEEAIGLPKLAELKKNLLDLRGIYLD